ncbi:MAG: M23 family metallopeptidase [Oscillospiraceae bacterium]|nr:M23 family metallopeptidase [Oscillospiraceae bacterium]
MGDWRTHAGIDIKGALGAKVTAAADGKVADILRDDMLGTVVVVDHGFGMLSYSANLASSPTVKVGDTVSAGSVIGAIGSTALGETGDVSHLHFELRLNGAPVDPAAYLR